MRKLIITILPFLVFAANALCEDKSATEGVYEGQKSTTLNAPNKSTIAVGIFKMSASSKTDQALDVKLKISNLDNDHVRVVNVDTPVYIKALTENLEAALVSSNKLAVLEREEQVNLGLEKAFQSLVKDQSISKSLEGTLIADYLVYGSVRDAFFKDEVIKVPQSDSVLVFSNLYLSGVVKLVESKTGQLLLTETFAKKFKKNNGNFNEVNFIAESFVALAASRVLNTLFPEEFPEQGFADVSAETPVFTGQQISADGINEGSKKIVMSVGNVLNTDWRSVLANQLSAELLNSDKFKIIERADLDTVIDEKLFINAVKERDANSLKELAGVDYLVNIQVEDSSVELLEKYIKTVDEYQKVWKAKIAGNYKILDTHTGQVVLAGDQQIETKTIKTHKDLNREFAKLIASDILHKLFPNEFQLKVPVQVDQGRKGLKEVKQINF